MLIQIIIQFLGIEAYPHELEIHVSRSLNVDRNGLYSLCDRLPPLGSNIPFFYNLTLFYNLCIRLVFLWGTSHIYQLYYRTCRPCIFQFLCSTFNLWFYQTLLAICILFFYLFHSLFFHLVFNQSVPSYSFYIYPTLYIYHNHLGRAFYIYLLLCIYHDHPYNPSFHIYSLSRSFQNVLYSPYIFRDKVYVIYSDREVILNQTFACICHHSCLLSHSCMTFFLESVLFWDVYPLGLFSWVFGCHFYFSICQCGNVPILYDRPYHIRL